MSKENRLISDHTFAVRFLSYLAMHYEEASQSHLIFEEEYEYLLRVSINLLKEQVENCPPSEEWYFKNLDPNYQGYQDIIKNHICKNKPEFYDYLLKGKFLPSDKSL